MSVEPTGGDAAGRTHGTAEPRDGVAGFGNDADAWLLSRPFWPRVIVAAVVSVVGLAALVSAALVLPEATDLQFAGSGTKLTDLLDAADPHAVRNHLVLDTVFILTAAAAGIVWASLVNGRHRARPSTRFTVYAVVLGAALMDLVEDALTGWADATRPVGDAWADAILAFAGMKWFLLAVLAVLAIGAIGHRLKPSVEADSMVLGHRRTVPEPELTIPAEVATSWQPPGPADGAGTPPPARVGIACSGGGIRSASFCLGALHGLGPDIVRGASYLSAASGGAYIAAAMTAHELAAERIEKRVQASASDLAAQVTALSGAAAPGGDPWPASEDPVALARAALEAGLYAREQGAAAPEAAAWARTFAAAASRQAVAPEEQAAARVAGTFADDVQDLSTVDGERTPASPLPFGQEVDPAFPARRRDSAELSRLRARVSYLLLNGGEGRTSVFVVVSGLLVNLFVLGLVLFAVARPIGWAMSSSVLHPELRAQAPLLHDIGLGEDLEDEDLRVTGPIEVDCEDGSAPGLQYTVELGPGPRALTMDYAAGATSDPSPAPATEMVLDRPGVIEVCAGRVEILRQPGFVVAGEEIPVAKAITVHASTLVTTADDVAALAGDAAPEINHLVEIDEQPTFTADSGAAGRDKISIDLWMWLTFGIGLFGAVVSTSLGWGALHGRHELTTRLSKFGVVCLVLAGATFALGIALPWAMQEVPDRFGDPTGAMPGPAHEIWGLLVWLAGVLAAARAALAGLRKDADAKTSKAKRTSRLVLKVGALAFLVVAGLVALYAVLQTPVLGGPTGLVHVGYWSSVHWLRQPDALYLLVVVLLLLVTRRLVPAYVWSMNPLYRDRLGKAFIGDSRDDDVHREVREATILGEPRPDRPWPELVVCAAVNLNSEDPANRIPGGRWADSFTFSRQAIGSPATRYVRSLEYADTLEGNRHTDLQLSSLVAVSGAAFSPGMGKEGYGAVGGLLAVLNLWLGLWLPNPSWIRANTRWRLNAGWPYLLREVFGRFRRSSPYVYVTDGGHWENLGLVELIRRGCTEIYVLSAAGDGSRSFSTAGEALALAREQFGVDIEIELTPLRARAGEDPPKEGRQLLDLENDQAERSFAPSPYAIGWFTYDNGVRARILFIEANLTDDLAWDVHSHAERHAVFPDDSTANQLFNHRQFEAYRRLGIHQAEAGAESEDWAAAELWRRGELTAAQLARVLSIDS